MEILQCDFPGVWVTWFVMFSYTGHLIGLAHGPLPLQIECLVKETPAVCIDPSGDSEGGGEMQGHLCDGVVTLYSQVLFTVASKPPLAGGSWIHF